MKKLLLAAGLVAAYLFAASGAFAQTACKNRGELDVAYCDDNGDLVADLPKDPKKWKNPSTLVWAYTPVEDPAVYEKIFSPFTQHLAACTGKKVCSSRCRATLPKSKRCAPAGCMWPGSPPGRPPSR